MQKVEGSFNFLQGGGGGGGGSEIFSTTKEGAPKKLNR